MNASEIRARLSGMKDEIDSIMALLATEPGTVIKPKLALIVGHDNRDGGALSPTLGTNEYAWNKDLAARMEYAALGRLDVQTFLRDGIGVSGAYAAVKAWGADAAIELHFNAFYSPAATGTETLYATPVSIPLATAAQSAMVAVLSLRDRGVKDVSGERGGGNVSHMGDRPSILIEPFFGSNPADARQAELRKDDLAKAVIEAATAVLTEGT